MLCGNDDFDWIPYPRSYRTTYDTKSARLPDIRQGMVDISKILSDAQGLLCQGNRGASPEDLWREVQAYFNRLDTWLQRWPSVSEMEVDPVPQFFIVRYVRNPPRSMASIPAV